MVNIGRRALVNLQRRLTVLAFIITVATPVIAALQLPPNPTLQMAYMCLLAAMTLAFLAWKAPDVAAGLFSGGPSLSATHTFESAAVAGRLLFGGGRGSNSGTRTSMGQIARGTHALLRGAGAVVGSAQGGARTGNVMAGMARAAARGAASPIQSGAESLKGSWNAGRVAGFRAAKPKSAPPA